MTTAPDDLGLRPVPATWYEPAPGTTAHKVRAAVRWAAALTFGFACVAFLIWCDLGGSTLTP
ncbi:hypothetical protein FM125_06430 [Micrococcus lylae]|uniref:Uncharacterized protein n=1 Tax=Micrococcus lylae TaxID=1273 RepID=A0A1R4J4B9_9MICC|nr:hypothetical protein [Micrococcus lylae]SJN26882.1 hypothetical protein FM125_06430 [Micrococcus lylae]